MDEVIFKAKTKELSSQLDKHTKKLDNIISGGLKNATSKKSYWNKVNAQITKEYKEMKTLYNSWAKTQIPEVYRETVRDLMTSLNKQKTLANRMKSNFTSVVTSPESSRMMKSLYIAAQNDYLDALVAGKNNLLKLTKKTRQAILAEKAINSTIYEAIASGNIMSNTVLKNSGTLANLLKEYSEVIDGKKYVIVGKGKKKRRYSPKYYSEMVTRVKFHEAQAYGTLKVCENYGTDLVQVSNHNTKTPICMKYENKIFSISGKDKRFPKLDMTPPFHVNCLHLLFPIFIESMEVDGTLDKWSSFSKGGSASPPGKTSYIPLANRGLK